MQSQELIVLYKKLEELISFCYEKYKAKMTEAERNECEEYLYQQGEYELALDSLQAIIVKYEIELDEECLAKIKEAKILMDLE